jgi:hypothetical protein
MSQKQAPLLASLEQFLFEVPLYAPYHLGTDRKLLDQFYGKAPKVDGYCIDCGRESTFKVRGASVPGGDPWINLAKRHAFDAMMIECARNEHHNVHYWFYLRAMVVQTIGQYPSLADIANDETKVYRKLLSPEMAAEFHKAVGLAAHGVGVGSFVYLRRIFERLIEGRFHEFREAEGWGADAFYKSRMEDKVLMLKKHLPEFLVANRKIYSILSIGIHELSEEACLGYFDVMRRSIIMILEDDRKAREEREQREAFARAIADFQSPPSGKPE